METAKHRVSLSLRCAGFALACLGGIAPVLAAESSERHVTVKYEDLNLNTPEGAATLLARIRGAARQVCGQQSARLDLQHAWQVCYDNSVNAAVATVDNPQLSALARGSHYGATTALNR
jgi:UrcA family protein